MSSITGTNAIITALIIKSTAMDMHIIRIQLILFTPFSRGKGLYQNTFQMFYLHIRFEIKTVYFCRVLGFLPQLVRDVYFLAYLYCDVIYRLILYIYSLLNSYITFVTLDIPSITIRNIGPVAI